MEVSVTRRIIGALVLGVIAIIVLPQIFDGEGRVPHRESLKIPPVIKKPDVSSLKVDLPVEVRASTNIKRLTEEEVVAKVDTPKPVVVEDDNSENTSPKSSANSVWSLQIASFKDSNNAARLRDKLRSGGFRSYNKESRLSDGSLLTQVLVGPVQDYEDALTLKTSLISKAKDLGVSGPPLVVKYAP